MKPDDDDELCIQTWTSALRESTAVNRHRCAITCQVASPVPVHVDITLDTSLSRVSVSPSTLHCV